MNIELKNHNRILDLIRRTHSKIEDLFFSVVLMLPDKLLPSFILRWIDHYTTKRMNDLEQQLIKERWRSMELQKVQDELIRK